MDISDRILKAEDLAKIIEQEKQNGKKVVFTNGIFDFVHVGHATILEKAKALGDILVVGLNSDTSTKQIKGPERPINKEDDRAYIVASLKSVDYVTIFEETTASETIETIKPSIYCKGGDYTVESLPETPSVHKVGGEVKIIPLKGDYSNSKQYKKIKDIENVEGQRADHVSKRS
tara:strand:+ start:2028 stop:2552 length:525 start_codon:yes stop_codon:yes gene_type:complete